MHDRQEVLDYTAQQDHPVFLTGGSGVFRIDDRRLRSVVSNSDRRDIYRRCLLS